MLKLGPLELNAWAAAQSQLFWAQNFARIQIMLCHTSISPKKWNSGLWADTVDFEPQASAQSMRTSCAKSCHRCLARCKSDDTSMPAGATETTPCSEPPADSVQSILRSSHTSHGIMSACNVFLRWASTLSCRTRSWCWRNGIVGETALCCREDGAPWTTGKAKRAQAEAEQGAYPARQPVCEL